MNEVQSPESDQAMTDEMWPMIEEVVQRLFDDVAGEYTAIGSRLAEMGWSDIETEYPVEACELLFRAQGRALAQTDCLDRVMLAELAAVLDAQVDAIVVSRLSDAGKPASIKDRVDGIVLGPLNGRVLVPVSAAAGTVSVGLVDAATLHARRLDTFDPSVHWTVVTGPLEAHLVEATREWNRAVAAAHRALATELVSVTDQMLGIAVEHAKSRVQFGAAIGSFQSPRHALAEACGSVEGARALLGQAWRYGEPLCARAAKAVAGRAHRFVADIAMQICAAIGLSAEHDLHRYVRRGFQLDALLCSHNELETIIAAELFDAYSPGHALPAIVMCC